MQGDFGGLARSAYKCVSLARLRSCTRVHSRRLASQSRISACNLASLDSAAAAAREVWRKTRYLGLSRCPKYRVFLILHGDIFCGVLRLRRVFCLGGISRSYEYMKIRVRLMRTEEDVNENEEHFVHVGRESLRSRADVGRCVYLCCLSRFCAIGATECIRAVCRFAFALGVLLRLHRSYSLSV